MAVTVEWEIMGRVAQAHLIGNITAEDIQQMDVGFSRLLVEEGIPPVHLLIDLSGVQKYPTTLSAYREIVQPPEHGDKIGLIVIFGSTNPIIRFLASVLSQLMTGNSRLRMADSLAKAMSYLYERDASLKSDHSQ